MVESQFLVCRTPKTAWCAIVLLATVVRGAAAQGDDRLPTLQASGPVQLDWAFPLIGRSPVETPEALLKATVGRNPTYEFYGPQQGDAELRPLVVFVSPDDRAVGWEFCKPFCLEREAIYAGLLEQGNGRPIPRRVQATLAVLEDLRSRYRIDPDRTYLAGFSGGAHVACLIAFALPEYFGGVVCLGNAATPPVSPAQRTRVARRLSIAVVCGARDPQAPAIEDLYAPLWEVTGVRTESTLVRGLAHRMPPPDVVSDALSWLDDDAGRRRETAANSLSLRIADAPSRYEWAARRLDDAKRLIADSAPASIDAATLELRAIVERWPDVPAATTAEIILSELASRADRPWEAIRQAEEAKWLKHQAEGYDRLAFDGRPAARRTQARSAQHAIRLWNEYRRQAVDPQAIAHARGRIAELSNRLTAVPPESQAIPLKQFRLAMEGDVTLGQAIDCLRQALVAVGYELQVDESELRAGGAAFDSVFRPRIKAGTLDDIDRRFFRRAGVRLQRVGTVVKLIPLATPKAEQPAK